MLRDCDKIRNQNIRPRIKITDHSSRISKLVAMGMPYKLTELTNTGK